MVETLIGFAELRFTVQADQLEPIKVLGGRNDEQKIE